MNGQTQVGDQHGHKNAGNQPGLDPKVPPVDFRVLVEAKDQLFGRRCVGANRGVARERIVAPQSVNGT